MRRRFRSIPGCDFTDANPHFSFVIEDRIGLHASSNVEPTIWSGILFEAGPQINSSFRLVKGRHVQGRRRIWTARKKRSDHSSLDAGSLIAQDRQGELVVIGRLSVSDLGLGLLKLRLT